MTACSSARTLGQVPISLLLLQHLPSTHRIEHSGDGRDRSFDILIRSLPVADAHSHCPPAAPRRSTEICLAIPYYRSDHPVSPLIMIPFDRARLWIEEPDQALIDYWLPQDFGARQTSDANDQVAGMPAAALNQI